MDKKEALTNDIKAYITEITNIKSCLLVYKQIHEKIKVEDDLAKINMAPAFFQTAIYGLRYSIIMGVAKLYDNGTDSKTIRKLIARCQTEIALFPEQNPIIYIDEDTGLEDYSHTEYKDTNINQHLTKFKCKVDEIGQSEELSNIKESRDKIYGHNDSKYFEDKFRAPQIPIADIEKLLDFSEEVCSTLLLVLCNESFSTTPEGVDDLELLLNAVTI